MKNLYLAILLLAFAANLSAFDKVWELQFSSTPHHVHYTEGHKELIVGEGNTFKKYNAETGVLVDSVVYSLPDSAQAFIVTDDLKTMYILLDSKNIFSVVKYNLITWEIQKTLLSITKSNFNTPPTFYKIGSFVQISNNQLLVAASKSVYNVDRPGTSGTLYLINNESVLSGNYGQTDFLSVNTFNKSYLVVSSVFGPYHGPAGGSDYYNRVCNYWDTQKSMMLPVTYGISSINHKYIYYVIDSNRNDLGYINRYSFDNTLASNYIGREFRDIVQFGNDDELIIKKNNIAYHYNFKVKTFLDSIDLGGNYQYLTDLNNNYLLSIYNNKVTAYKSGFSSNKVISQLKDTLIIKSTSDTITLNAISNLTPTKVEWDLGDGRKRTTDTARFTFTKNGEYVVKYTATYIDTVVRHTCKIKVYKFDYDYDVKYKKGFTDLTFITRLEGNFATLKTNISQPNFSSSFTVYDSSASRIVYRLYQSGIYNINFNISYLNYSSESNIKLVLPIMKVDNTSYEYEKLPFIYNFISFNKNLYLLNFSYTNLGCENLGDYQNPHYNCKFNLNTEILSTSNYKYNNSVLKESTGFSNLGNFYTDIRNNEEIENFARSYALVNIYKQQRLISNKSNIYIQNNARQISTFNNSSIQPYKYPINQGLNFKEYNVIENKIAFLCKIDGKNQYYSFSIDTLNKTITDTVTLYSSYYDNVTTSIINNNKFMLSSVKDLKVFSIDNSFRIIDTLMTEKYNKVYSKSINGNHAFAIIDTNAKDTIQYLKVMDIKNKKSKLVKLDNSVKYHQVSQVNDSITCLMGRKDKNLVIETFKNKLLYFSSFKIEHTGMFTILEKTDDNELHLSFVDTSIPASNLITTKGFASIFDYVNKTKDTTKIPYDTTAVPIDITHIRVDSNIVISIDTTVNPIDTTETPKDTTKNKGIIQNKDNQFGTVIQDPEFKVAKIYFKDSLELSNSFVKIYTEAGTEILTYSLSKDQKELPIRTDKLYHGIYYVRLLNKGEEYNLGKFIIVR